MKQVIFLHETSINLIATPSHHSSQLEKQIMSSTPAKPERDPEGSKQSAVQDELMYRPLVDIAVELRRLREENERLRVDKQRLDALLPVS